MTSPTNNTLYRTVVVNEKKNRSLVFSGFRKIPTLQASFPTGTVGPRVGIFLSPLNTNDGFFLSHISYAYLTWVAMWDRYLRQQANIGITRSCMRWYVRNFFLAHLSLKTSCSIGKTPCGISLSHPRDLLIPST